MEKQFIDCVVAVVAVVAVICCCCSGTEDGCMHTCSGLELKAHNPIITFMIGPNDYVTNIADYVTSIATMKGRSFKTTRAEDTAKIFHHPFGYTYYYY